MTSRRQQDHYGRRAKHEGKAARSIYKLEEIDARWRLLRPGMRVLDLGCAPGSWMQYAAERVGPQGRVVGYDLKAVAIGLPPWAESRVGDVFTLSPASLGGPYDVVLSDMAPSTMGDHHADAARSASLVEAALQIAAELLRPGGAIVAKVLEGGEMPRLVERLRDAYARVERLRPKATRRESTEIFLIGLGHKAQPHAPTVTPGAAGA